MLPCQFHLLGRCTKGSSCVYSHDPARCRPGGAGRPCHEYVAIGVCKNGNRCVFLHQSGSHSEQAYFYGAAESANDLVGLYGEAPLVGDEASRVKTGRTSSSAGTTWAKVARLPGHEVLGEVSPSRLPHESEDSTSPNDHSHYSARAHQEQPQPMKSRVPCKFFPTSAGCRAGASCRYSHDRSDFTNTETSGHAATCGICFDDLRFKRIGLLTNCDHLFCLNCIRSWRSSEMSEVERTKGIVQTCPSCRVRSFYTVPSDKIPASAEEKNRIITEYRAQCKKVRCKYKDDDCPFGASCLFYHDVVDPAKLGLRFAKTAEGGDHALSSKVATIGDFILK